jgi:hypothetical protein
MHHRIRAGRGDVHDDASVWGNPFQCEDDNVSVVRKEVEMVDRSVALSLRVRECGGSSFGSARVRK